MNTNENEITFRYSLPAAIVSGLFVKIFIIAVGIGKEKQKYKRDNQGDPFCKTQNLLYRLFITFSPVLGT